MTAVYLVMPMLAILSFCAASIMLLVALSKHPPAC
jgi:hypothetical protein